MLGRDRLKAVKWLLLAALLQVAAPAEAAFMVVCPAMAPTAGAGASASMPGMDMAGMAGMDMAGMLGMDHRAAAFGSPDPAGHGAPAPAQCQYDCCTGGLVPLAAPAPLLPTVPRPLAIVVQVRSGSAAPAEVRGARVRLRPAIRAPPPSV